MACVTALKRGLDLENYGHPYEHSPKRHCSSNRQSFSPKTNSLNLESLSLNNANNRGSGGGSSPKQVSEFPPLSSIPSNKILEQVTSEARNLKRRRELPSQKGMKRGAPPSEKTTGSGSDDSDDSADLKLYRRIQAIQNTAATTQQQQQSTAAKCKQQKETKKASFSNPDQELRLTLRNVAKICESLLRQREDSIREEYDKILHEKLQEQYEVWCRYNQDQLSRHASGSSHSNYIS